jgi:hypothetical protein
VVEYDIVVAEESGEHEKFVSRIDRVVVTVSVYVMVEAAPLQLSSAPASTVPPVAVS